MYLGFLRDYGFGLVDWIYWHFIHSTRNYSQLEGYRCFYNLQFTVKHTSVLSLLHSPVVVSWQRILKNLTVTSNYHEDFFAQSNSCLAIILPTSANDSLNSLLQLPTLELDSILILAAWDPNYIASGWTQRKHRWIYCFVLIHFCRKVFTAQLRSN
jgi:hypothetical protein